MSVLVSDTSLEFVSAELSSLSHEISQCVKDNLPSIQLALVAQGGKTEHLPAEAREVLSRLESLKVLTSRNLTSSSQALQRMRSCHIKCRNLSLVDRLVKDLLVFRVELKRLKGFLGADCSSCDGANVNVLFSASKSIRRLQSTTGVSFGPSSSLKVPPKDGNCLTDLPHIIKGLEYMQAARTGVIKEIDVLFAECDGRRSSGMLQMSLKVYHALDILEYKLSEYITESLSLLSDHLDSKLCIRSVARCGVGASSQAVAPADIGFEDSALMMGGESLEEKAGGRRGRERQVRKATLRLLDAVVAGVKKEIDKVEGVKEVLRAMTDDSGLPLYSFVADVFEGFQAKVKDRFKGRIDQFLREERGTQIIVQIYPLFRSSINDLAEARVVKVWAGGGREGTVRETSLGKYDRLTSLSTASLPGKSSPSDFPCFALPSTLLGSLSSATAAFESDCSSKLAKLVNLMFPENPHSSSIILPSKYDVRSLSSSYSALLSLADPREGGGPLDMAHWLSSIIVGNVDLLLDRARAYVMKPPYLSIASPSNIEDLGVTDSLKSNVTLLNLLHILSTSLSQVTNEVFIKPYNPAISNAQFSTEEGCRKIVSGAVESIERMSRSIVEGFGTDFNRRVGEVLVEM